MSFPTMASHWHHFSEIDIDPRAPQAQRDEMERAFMAGVASTLLMLKETAPAERDAKFNVLQRECEA